MKTMKITIAAAVALAACASTSLFAQVKEDVITFSLTGQEQVSVSSSATIANAGSWSHNSYKVGSDTLEAGPLYYKTKTTKLTEKDLLKFIGFTLHGNANYYSTKAQLVLVQGELSGFFNITYDLGKAYPDNDILDGDTLEYPILEGGDWHDTGPLDPSTDIANSTDSAFVTLDNGHHFYLNNTSPDDFSGVDEYPVGHLQPWGQVFVKDIGKAGFSATDPLCENVTYFFAFSVEECYDCFYMNSFVSDATFSFKATSQSGPPCCTTPAPIVGKGKDRYYLTLSFDDSMNNPYLNFQSDIYVGVDGLASDAIPGDGLIPDSINALPMTDNYNDPIKALVGKNEPYLARFTLNGILTYTWNLQFLNTSDISPEFLGSASYPVSGYGFVALFCELFTGTVAFNEHAVKTACCLDQPWYDDWFGPGAEYYDFMGEDQVEVMDWTLSDLTRDDMAVPGVSNDAISPEVTPINVYASLSYHHNFDFKYPWAQNNWGAGWPTPAVIEPVGLGAPFSAVGWGIYGVHQF